jgi:hypothetical protein
MADMNELANDLEQEVIEKNELEKEEVEENLENKSTPELITAEYAKEFGISKHMIGKPIKELGTAYSELNKFATKLSQEQKEIRSEIASLKSELTTKQVATVEKTVEKETTDLIGEAPESMDFSSPAEYKKAMREYLDKRDQVRDKLLMDSLEKKMDEKYGSKITKQEQAQLEQEVEKNTNLMIKTVNEGLESLFDGKLPEGYSVDDLLDEWQKSVEEDNTPEELKQLYGGKPSKMAKDIIRFQKEKLYDENKSSIKDPKLLEKIHQEQVDKLKNKNSKATRLNTSAREKSDGDKVNDPWKQTADELEQEYKMNRERK